MDANVLQKRIVDILDRYDTLPDDGDVKAFLVKEMLASGKYADKEEASLAATQIAETIDAVDSAYKSLQAAKAQGDSREKWLHDQLAENIASVPADQRESVVQELTGSLGKANSDVSGALFSDNLLPKGAALESYAFEDLNARVIAKRIHQDIQDNTVLGAISVEEGFRVRLDTGHKEVVAAKKFLESALDSPRDADFKKVVTGAVDISKRAGHIPSLQGKSPGEIALMVDQGVTVAKLGYKVAQGEFSPTDVTDYLIDKTATRVSTVLKHSCSKAGTAYGMAIGAAVGSVFGPVGTAWGAVAGAIVGGMAGEKIGSLVVRGVEKVAHTAKETCRKVWKGAKAVAGKVWDFIFS